MKDATRQTLNPDTRHNMGENMTYIEAIYQAYAAARFKLTQEGRMGVRLYDTNYTNPVTGERKVGYIVTPLRLEWD